MRLSAPIYRLKRQAKLLSREQNIPLHQALDRIAVSEGYKRWSHLTAAAPDRPLPETVLDQLAGGDMLLLAARPGHGKTLVGLEIAALARRRGITGLFFTLDYTERDVAERLKAIDTLTPEAAASVSIDTSDEICAEHIIERLRMAQRPALAVIDYLQLLDQRRATPELDQQIVALQAHAAQSGDIIVAISQIDRGFEMSGRSLPDLTDIRLPNPVDLGQFNRTCFLHEGRALIDAA